MVNVVKEIHFQKLSDQAKQLGISISELYSRKSRGLIPPFIAIGIRGRRAIHEETDEIARAYVTGKSDNEIKTLVSNLTAARNAPEQAAQP